MASHLSDEKIKILNSPPFVNVQGVINIRDAGGYPSLAYPDKEVKRGYLYRAGEPSRITEKGKAQLVQLDIKMVFDLRSDTEINGYKAAPLIVEGVDFVRAPVSRTESYDPVSLAVRMKAFESDALDTFMKLYMEIIDQGGEAIEKILLHIRDKPDTPCLIHCTAGKDRTGSFIAIILLLLGVSNEDIVKDYALTTVGLEPALPFLVERFKAQEAFRANWTGTMNMASSDPETMVALLEKFGERYGSAENYIKTQTSLVDEDIARIRDNLLVSRA